MGAAVWQEACNKIALTVVKNQVTNPRDYLLSPKSEVVLEATEQHGSIGLRFRIVWLESGAILGVGEDRGYERLGHVIQRRLEKDVIVCEGTGRRVQGAWVGPYRQVRLRRSMES